MRTLGLVIGMSDRGDTFTRDSGCSISSLRMGVELVAAGARSHWGMAQIFADVSTSLSEKTVAAAATGYELTS